MGEKIAPPAYYRKAQLKRCRLAHETQFIGLADRNVRGLLAHKASLAYHHLAKSSAGTWGLAGSRLPDYQGAGEGCRVEKISRGYPPSKTGAGGETELQAQALKVRLWLGPPYGTVHDRHVNAAARAAALAAAIS